MLGWILMGSGTLLNFNGRPIPLVYHRWTSLETGGGKLAPKKKYRTLRGLKAAAKDGWSKIPVEQFQNALSSWSKRVLEFHKAKGRSRPQ